MVAVLAEDEALTKLATRLVGPDIVRLPLASEAAFTATLSV